MIINITCPEQIATTPNIYTLISFLALVICIFITHHIYKENNFDKKANIFFVLSLIYPFFLFGSKLFSNFYYRGFRLYSFDEFMRGGMSLHGALLLSIFPILLLKKISGFSPLKLGSILLTPLGIGIFFIRIANTLNCEILGIYSRENDFLKILYLGKSLIPRIPIQIVEGGVFLLLSLAFIFFRKKLIPKNLTIKIFLIVFPLTRMITDRFKVTPENHISEGLYFLKSDILGLLFLLIAIILITIDRNRLKTDTH